MKETDARIRPKPEIVGDAFDVGTFPAVPLLPDARLVAIPKTAAGR
jgi:hypothetical protein